MPRAPRLPLLPDPLRRIRVPRDLKSVTTVGGEEDPEPLGVSRRTIERIWGASRELYRTGVHPAVQLCLRRNGRVVLDRAVGHARGNGPHDAPDAEKVLVSPQTPFCIFSSSKAVTAMHLVQEHGALEIADRVSDYIPQYAVHGKSETTIGHVLAHRAGVPGLPAKLLDPDRAGDREFVLKTLCEAKPVVKPGTLLAYHAISGGFILDEIVQRVTGKTVRDVLAESILEPLGFRW